MRCSRSESISVATSSCATSSGRGPSGEGWSRGKSEALDGLYAGIRRPCERRRELSAMKEPVLPIPAEQFTVMGGSGWKGCSFGVFGGGCWFTSATRRANLKSLAFSSGPSGTPKSGHSWNNKWVKRTGASNSGAWWYRGLSCSTSGISHRASRMVLLTHDAEGTDSWASKVILSADVVGGASSGGGTIYDFPISSGK